MQDAYSKTYLPSTNCLLQLGPILCVRLVELGTYQNTDNERMQLKANTTHIKTYEQQQQI